MTYRAHARYSQSGLDWPPSLPHEWGHARLKQVSEFAAGGTPETDRTDYWDDADGVPWVAIGDMSGRKEVTSTTKALTIAGLRSKRLRVAPVGTLIFAMYASVGEVSRLAIDATWNQAILGITGNPDRADTRFVEYTLRSLRPYFASLYRSNTQNNLNAEQVGSLPMPLPSLTEQRTIAEFLDRETAQIDELIGKQNALIAFLAERRKAVITRAVTKGLDPKAPMKDSGVEWLGEVPRHWIVLNFKYAATLLPGYSFASESFSEDDTAIRLLRGINVGLDRISWKETVYWADEVAPNLAEYSLRTGDIVLGLDRPIISGGLRIAEVRAQDLPALLVQRVARIRPRTHVTSTFLRMVLMAEGFGDYLAPIFTGVSVPHLSTDQVGNFTFALPPVSEQKLISAHLTEDLSRVNELVMKAEHMVAILQERRSALITAAVTGKIDVRGAA